MGIMGIAPETAEARELRVEPPSRRELVRRLVETAVTRLDRPVRAEDVVEENASLGPAMRGPDPELFSCNAGTSARSSLTVAGASQRLASLAKSGAILRVQTIRGAGTGGRHFYAPIGWRPDPDVPARPDATLDPRETTLELVWRDFSRVWSEHVAASNRTGIPVRPLFTREYTQQSRLSPTITNVVIHQRLLTLAQGEHALIRVIHFRDMYYYRAWAPAATPLEELDASNYGPVATLGDEAMAVCALSKTVAIRRAVRIAVRIALQNGEGGSHHSVGAVPISAVRRVIASLPEQFLPLSVRGVGRALESATRRTWFTSKKGPRPAPRRQVTMVGWADGEPHCALIENEAVGLCYTQFRRCATEWAARQPVLAREAGVLGVPDVIGPARATACLAELRWFHARFDDLAQTLLPEMAEDLVTIKAWSVNVSEIIASLERRWHGLLLAQAPHQSPSLTPKITAVDAPWFRGPTISQPELTEMFLLACPRHAWATVPKPRLERRSTRIRRFANPQFTALTASVNAARYPYVYDLVEAKLCIARKYGGTHCMAQASIATEALGPLREFDAVLQLATSDVFVDRLTAIACLAFGSGDIIRARLLALVQDDRDSTVRLAALWAHAFAEGGGSVRVLREQAASDPTIRVRSEAERLVQHFEEAGQFWTV